MNNNIRLKNKKRTKADLMKQILNIRYTDIEAEKDLCKQLLDVAEPENDAYGCAFANVYLFDSHLALGEYSNCDFYLIRAQLLCNEHEYNDLSLMLCNCAGLYYLKLNDEQSALEYYLEGLKLARRLGDYDMESKILNNVGIGFGGRDDWESAKSYFYQAFQAIEPHIQESNNFNVISYLCNLSEACQGLGDLEGSEKALSRCEQLNIESLYHNLRLMCGKATLYASLGDRDRCIEMDDKVIELGLLSFHSKFFVCDMCIGNCESMIKFDERKRAERYLHVLDENFDEAAIVTKYRIQCLKISYFEKYNISDQLEKAYHDYYDIVDKMTLMDDQSRSQSMLSKIQLTNVLLEREAMHKKNSELESAGQLDELTGLYNRRYFNKLISKFSSDLENISSLGFIMLDVDYFKQYNDYYGHFMGDDALKAVADTLHKFKHDGIYVSRYGGDEFVCLCVNLPDQTVEDYIINLEKDLTDKNIPHEKSIISNRLTLSIGYCNENAVKNIDSLIKQSDDALYQAKREGRNRHARIKLS